jgi:hypothetical protein
MTFKVPGCTNSNACNFDPFAQIDDGTCAMKIRGCTVRTAENYDTNANSDPGDRCSSFSANDDVTQKQILTGITLVSASAETARMRIASIHQPAFARGRDSDQKIIATGRYPYWTIRVKAMQDGENVPVGLKVKGGDNLTLTTILYTPTFGPAKPDFGLAADAQTGVKCEHPITLAVTEGGSWCSGSSQMRTSLVPGLEYSIVVMSDAPEPQLPSEIIAWRLNLQQAFELQILASQDTVDVLLPQCGNGVVDGKSEQCDPVSLSSQSPQLNGAEAEWCSLPLGGEGGCQGIMGGFSFELATVSVIEGTETQVKIIRHMPPSWLAHDAATKPVSVKVFTADGTALKQQKDYDDIEGKDVSTAA